jgi:hypothetical protein
MHSMKYLQLRFETILSVLFLFFAVPYTAFGASIFTSTIVPRGSCLCPGSAPSWGCVLQLIQNVMNAVVGLGILLCVLWIAYAGFSMMTSGGVAEARSLAKTRLLNAVIGIVVILSSWLIIDFVMKALYNVDTHYKVVYFGPWNSILAPEGDSYCLQPNENPIGLTSGFISIITSGVSTGIGAGNQIGVAKGLCADSNTACSVAVLQREGLSLAEAKAMSCIAVTESAGGANKGNSGTGALGLYQITGTNWANPAYHSGSCSASISRLNNDCNRQAAVLMYRHVGYQPWTGKCLSTKGCGYVSYGQYWNPNAVACVQKYDP